MSQEANSKSKCPIRPPPPDPSRLRTLRLTRLTRSEEVHVETCNLSLESENIPTYIDVLSDKSSDKKDGAPARPPPPVLKRSFLSQTTETQDSNGHSETSDIRNTESTWHNKNGEATEDGSTYIDVLPNERSLTKDVRRMSEAPARPPPPVLKRSFLFQTTETQDLNGLTEMSDIRNTETSWHNENSEATVDGSTYMDVPFDERSLTNLTTPVNTAPPRPDAPPRLLALQPRKPFLCLSRSAEPTQHVYESIDNILSQNEDGVRGFPAGLARKGRPTTYHSWSEQSIVDGDSTARELDILLEWWRSTGGLENLLTDNQEEETVTKPLISVAQRVKTAMRLYELLLVQRCTDLLNHITELHYAADKLIKSNKKARVAKLTGGTTGAVGGVAIAAGLALAPLTFGASLVATGVGIGIVAAGGVTGASASFTKKKKGTQVKEKMEKIINTYKSQIEDILACLKFIDIRMKHLRMQDGSELKEMGSHLEKIGKVAQKMENINSLDIISEYFSILQDLDSYFSEEDNSNTKMNSNSQLAQKVHEVADKLKDCMDQLIRIKKLFRSIDDDDA